MELTKLAKTYQDRYKTYRFEMCHGGIPQFDPELDFDHPIMAMAGTQKMQGGLPAATQKVWKAVAKTFPKVTSLGAWGDTPHMARKSCHNTGKAVDVMTRDVATHAAIVKWALANRKELGISLIISRRTKWSAATGWKPKKYLGTSPHTDHVHLSVNCTL